MANNWQDAVRHCIRVNNIALERFYRWLADAELVGDTEQQVLCRMRIQEREMSNDDLQMLLEEYGDEREE